MSNRYVWEKYNFSQHYSETISAPTTIIPQFEQSEPLYGRGASNNPGSNKIKYNGDVPYIDTEYEIEPIEPFISVLYQNYTQYQYRENNYPSVGLYVGDNSSGSTIRVQSGALVLTYGQLKVSDKIEKSTLFATVSNASASTYPP